MGITGLLPFLSSVTKKKNLSDYKGFRIVIDGFVWLHSAAYCCARELYFHPDSPQILNFCMKRIHNMTSLAITPIVVFDGRTPEAKFSTVKSRLEARQNAIKQIQENPDCPDSVYNQAISITFATVTTFINALKREKIEYIVAPYEADAQMAYLAHIGYVDAVCTIDSDLLPYLSPLVFYKLDEDNNIDVIELSDVLAFLKMSPQEFQMMCILSGCDYTPKVGKLGIHTAYKLVKEFHENALIEAHKKPNLSFPENYDYHFSKALLTFNHQFVYDPNSRRCVNLSYIENPPNFLGTFIPDDEMNQLATGMIDPHHSFIEDETNEQP